MNFKKLHSNYALAFAFAMVLLFTGCSDDDVVEIVGDCPIVLSTVPVDGDTDVPLDQVITVTFNEGIDPETINEQTFTVDGTSSVAGAVAFSDNTASFTPAAELEPYTTYTGTVTTAIKDLMGNALQQNYVWSFTTLPEVSLSTTPEVGGTILGAGTFSNGSTVTVTALPNEGYIFTNWTVDDTEVSTTTSYQFEMDGNIALVANFEEVVLGNLRVNLSSSPIAGGTTEGSGQFSANSNVTVTALPNPGYVFVNWTEGETVASTSSSYQFELTGNRTLVANYSELQENQFAVILSANPAVGGSTNGSGSYDAETPVTVTATPNTGYVFVNWTADQEEVSTDASYTFDLIANTSLVANFAQENNAGIQGINLRSAGDFAILAGAGIENTGVSTMIIGDVGSFPTADITGLLASNVNGTLYTSADPVVEQAKLDLTTAFNEAQARSLNAISLPGQLGGLTLTPGLYVNSTTSGISGTGPQGILTLDAGGDPNAVWIFKMGSTFITDAGTSIVLAGGAKAENIYWSVGTSATLGTNSSFYGNILADQAITLTTGATLVGRALTRIAAVSLDSNQVTKP